MPKFEVIRPWHGVTAGQIVELKEVHPSLAANVRAVGEGADEDGEAGKVLAAAREEAQEVVSKARSIHEEATAAAQKLLDDARAGAAEILDEAKAQAAKLLPPPDANERREVIKARLKELKIDFDGRKGEEGLAALLPDGELAKLFPAE
ncbi:MULTISPECIES: hypothetical protein [Pseudomonas]|uniref:hypothetical protein n=1 Tax=Pseudomonas TaxID=286 RepID=UPI0004D64F60|nr:MULTISPECIES: hypothetical protein [Pseudomonas]KES20139.1 hypothetical protein FG99_00080 [Pseudomonas sp. AAC]MBH3433676.1 hypothetical protein [Pseudomonas citronellolis]OHS11596.1 hypothetical protein HMPREF3289_08620 [Pseudomonas sp. HMSC75E02]